MEMGIILSKVDMFVKLRIIIIKKTKFILWIGVVSTLGVVPRAGGTLQLIVVTLV